MNITGMTTISSYLKCVNLNMKWQERKKNPQKEEELDPKAAEIKRWSENESRSRTISAIHGKLLAGTELTEEELDYLRQNNPDMYKQAVQVRKERELYKKELANCKSKEDVEKLNRRKLNQFCSEAKAIAGNPNIPKGKKVELLEGITMRMNAVLNDRAAFMKSKEYHNLPKKTDEQKRTNDEDQNEIGKDDFIGSETADPVKVVDELLADISAPEPGGDEKNVPHSRTKGEHTALPTDALIQTYKAYAECADTNVGNKGYIGKKVNVSRRA